MLHRASELNGFFGKKQTTEKEEEIYKIFVGKPEGKRPRGRLRA
jgi:hypothetical protein